MKHTHTLTRGKLDHPDGSGGTVRLVPGKTLIPTKAELRAFHDSLEPIQSPEPEPEPVEEQESQESDEVERRRALAESVKGMTTAQVLKAVDSGAMSSEDVRVAELAGQRRKGVLRGVAKRRAVRSRQRIN